MNGAMIECVHEFRMGDGTPTAACDRLSRGSCVKKKLHRLFAA